MKPFLRPLAGAGVLALALAGAAQARTVDAVASFSVLADVVQNVGGDHVKVRSLVPANGDPHDYEPSPEDAKAVKSAAVTFLSGEGLETWFQRLAKASGASLAPVVVSDGIKTHSFEEDGRTVTDPHVWNSAANVLIWVDNIEAALVKADPEDADAIHASAEAYRAKLKALDASIKAALAPIPVDQRKVLTSHDAFGYYGAEYDVTFLSPLGVSTETEASAADVAELIKQIRKEGVKVYFLENSNDSRLVKQIASATDAQPGGELYPESLSGSDGPAPSYLDLMAYNTKQIVSAISGK
ncbi:zinc ABC transporter substrate-binding protein [Pseudooceanicola sp. CBS1P-1]|uniref:Zinc ABC transporter solute-binding protein n=1 Tax=Pseudooceanicola albus TaxID=2692189 RepID=A0A6L7G8L6_9RHOB|nr:MULTISPECIES: zinc ABC transporter substrate-binding protein [Pseudooceanicola]MBT9385770.1 zinc ABC transporter substrate-binding protein [Pseudooceanicola endophyticus]MXN20002.1 zinc ABC transporter solute-binding protein [Pseudooceanicola albus]